MNRLRCAFVLLAMALSANADTIIVDASNFGFYHQNGLTASTTNHAIGWYPTSTPPGELRNFVIFDLASINGTITGATLRLFNPATGYTSPDANETFEIFDITSSLTDVASGVGSVSIFNDLGTGTSYGSVTAVFPNNANVEVILNASGLAYLNSVAGVGSAGIGGALTSIDFSNLVVSERLFNTATGNITRQLVLEVEAADVPEPSTFAMGIAGLVLLAAAGRRARR